MSTRGQCDRIAILRQRVLSLSSQLTELQNLRTRLEKAEERRMRKRSKVTGSLAMRRRSWQ